MPMSTINKSKSMKIDHDVDALELGDAVLRDLPPINGHNRSRYLHMDGNTTITCLN